MTARSGAGSDGGTVALRSRPGVAVLAAVFLGLWGVYLATATWSLPLESSAPGPGDRRSPVALDAFTNVFTARSLAAEHTPVLAWYEPPEPTPEVPRLAWLRSTPRGPASKYPPGAAIWGAPFYALPGAGDLVTVTLPDGQEAAVPSLWPAALAASLSAAVAVTLAAALCLDLGATGRQAAGVAVALGLGTGLWPNASDELWQHGPAAMWLALGAWGAARGRWWASALGWGAAALTRPPTALVAAVVGLGMAGVRRRRGGEDGPAARGWSLGPVTLRQPRAVVAAALGAGAGVAAYLAWNWWLYGELTLRGGYNADYAGRTVSQGLGWYAANLAAALGSPRYGLLVWSPFLAVLAVGARAGWRAAPTLPRAAALGGLAYLLLQYRINRASGGTGFLSYRYPVEALVVSAPLGFEMWRRRISGAPLASRALTVTVLVAVAVNGWAALIT